MSRIGKIYECAEYWQKGKEGREKGGERERGRKVRDSVNKKGKEGRRGGRVGGMGEAVKVGEDVYWWRGEDVERGGEVSVRGGCGGVWLAAGGEVRACACVWACERCSHVRPRPPHHAQEEFKGITAMLITSIIKISIVLYYEPFPSTQHARQALGSGHGLCLPGLVAHLYTAAGGVKKKRGGK